MIRAVFLDIDNTLLDFNASAAEAMATALANHGLVMPDGLVSVFHRVNNSLWRKIEEGTLTREELFAVRWPTIFREVGIGLDGAAFENEFRESMKFAAVPFREALPVVQTLAQHYALYTASNAWQDEQERRMRIAGLFPCFTKILTSDGLGESKPDPAFFSALLREAGTPDPRETVMVGDSLSADIHGAALSGMHTVWFNPSGLPVAEECSPEFSVQNLSELPDLLLRVFP